MIGIKWVEIRPRRKLEPDIFRLYLLTEARKIAVEAKDDLLSPTSTWTHKPKATSKVEFSGSKITFTATVEDPIYGILDAGDPESRLIKPVSSGIRSLRFPGTFTSKTIPGTLTARSGSRGDFIYAKYAIRPPIEPRRFEEAVIRKWQPKLAPRFQRALDEAARRSGYEI